MLNRQMLVSSAVAALLAMGTALGAVLTAEGDISGRTLTAILVGGLVVFLKNWQSRGAVPPGAGP